MQGTEGTGSVHTVQPADIEEGTPPTAQVADGKKPLTVRFAIVLVALAAIASVQAALTGPTDPRARFFDERRFEVWANNLYSKGFYGDTADSPLAREELRSVPYSAYVPPGYPFFLIALKEAHAGGPAPLRAAQAVLVGLTVLAIALLARRLFGPIAAVLSSVLLIATGVLATYAQFTLSEILSAATLTGAVVLSVIGLQRRSWRILLGASLLLGCSILVRPQVLLLPFPIAAFIFFAAGRKRRGLLLAGVFLVGSFVVVAPWTIRNELRLHAFVPVSTYTWINFWDSNNPDATGQFRMPERLLPREEIIRIRALPEVQQDSEWRKMAFEWIRENPGEAVKGWIRTGRQFVTGSDPFVIQYYRIHGVQIPRLDERWMFFAALIALVLALTRRRNWEAIGIPLIVVVYFMAFFSLFIASARFRVPLLAVLALLAAGIPELVIGIVHRRRGKRRTIGPDSGGVAPQPSTDGSLTVEAHEPPLA